MSAMPLKLVSNDILILRLFDILPFTHVNDRHISENCLCLDNLPENFSTLIIRFLYSHSVMMIFIYLFFIFFQRRRCEQTYYIISK